MPVVDGVGYGELTPHKLDNLRAIMRMHIEITMAVLRKHQNFNQVYHYVDANAGPGQYSLESGLMVQGSPLIFLQEATSAGLHYRADLVEKDSGNADSLRSSLPSSPAGAVLVHCGDQADILRRILSSRNEGEFGLLFVDPTGVPDFDTVAYVSDMRPRMEILMYVQATGVKRVRQYTGELLSDFVARVGKEYWLVRKPVSWDRFQFTFLLGSNASLFTDYKKIDFYRLESSEAQGFFPKLNYSKSEQVQRLSRKLLEEGPRYRQE